MEPSDLYFEQLAVGPMDNFIYLIGSQRSRECLIVDPAWDAAGLVEYAEEKGMRVVGALVTHYHADHVGGSMGPFAVPGGLTDLLAKVSVPIHVNKHELDFLHKVTGLGANDCQSHDAGDVIAVGDISIKLLHTPGHTPGSQCFLVQDRLVTGDTLFVNGCGRTDLPGGDAATLKTTLRELAKLPEHLIVCPGHDYARTPTNTIAEQKQSNGVLIDAM